MAIYAAPRIPCSLSSLVTPFLLNQVHAGAQWVRPSQMGLLLRRTGVDHRVCPVTRKEL